MSLGPSISLGVVTAALLGEVILYYQVKRSELQELSKIYSKLMEDSEALTTTNVFLKDVRAWLARHEQCHPPSSPMRTMSTQKYETLRRRIVHKQAVLDHSFSEMKCRTDTMAGTHATLNTDSLTSHLMGGIFFLLFLTRATIKPFRFGPTSRAAGLCHEVG